MIEGRPSQTAAYVAGWRALGECLPAPFRLCADPRGWSFAAPAFTRVKPFVQRFPRIAGRLLLASPLRRIVLWMQLRTRAIDDIAVDFARTAGDQIVLLGAGFDCRAHRLRGELGQVRWFEVDHPATQARKREALAGAAGAPAYVAWDFERQEVAALPDALAAAGFDKTRPSLTILEGVIPYLTEPAVAATLAAVRAYAGPGSRVVLNYITRERIHRRTFFRWAAARAGEPLRFGWDPPALPGWLGAHDFVLDSDRADDELARALFGEPWSSKLKAAGGRIAVAHPR
jgi:methyltransferase (TIGR00027 family)